MKVWNEAIIFKIKREIMILAVLWIARRNSVLNWILNLIIRKLFMNYWKFPMNPYVLLLVGRSIWHNFLKKKVGKLHFHWLLKTSLYLQLIVLMSTARMVKETCSPPAVRAGGRKRWRRRHELIRYRHETSDKYICFDTRGNIRAVVSDRLKRVVVDVFLF